MLKKMKFSLLLLMLMSSCAFVDEIHFYADDRLKEAVDSFYTEAQLHGKSLIKDRISFVISDEDSNGRKLSSTGLTEISQGFTTITINSQLFKNGQPDKLALEYIVMHEGGHYLGRGHNNNFSIMNPNKYAGEYHNDPELRKKLIDELFE